MTDDGNKRPALSSNSVMQRNFKGLAGQIGPNLTHKSSRDVKERFCNISTLLPDCTINLLDVLFTAWPVNCLIPNSCVCVALVYF